MIALPLGEGTLLDTTGTVKTPADYVIKHYGDWPAPEIFVVNTKTE